MILSDGVYGINKSWRCICSEESQRETLFLAKRRYIYYHKSHGQGGKLADKSGNEVNEAKEQHTYNGNTDNQNDKPARVKISTFIISEWPNSSVHYENSSPYYPFTHLNWWFLTGWNKPTLPEHVMEYKVWFNSKVQLT